MANGKWITDNEIRLVLNLTDAGKGTADIAGITALSTATISVIRSAARGRTPKGNENLQARVRALLTGTPAAVPARLPKPEVVPFDETATSLEFAAELKAMTFGQVQAYMDALDKAVVRAEKEYTLAFEHRAAARDAIRSLTGGINV